MNPLRVKNWIISEMETSLVLFDSGVSRSSARIIQEQTDNLVRHSGTTLDAMHAIKQDAFVMKECLLRGDFDGLRPACGAPGTARSAWRTT